MGPAALLPGAATLPCSRRPLTTSRFRALGWTAGDHHRAVRGQAGGQAEGQADLARPAGRLVAVRRDARHDLPPEALRLPAARRPDRPLLPSLRPVDRQLAVLEAGRRRRRRSRRPARGGGGGQGAGARARTLSADRCFPHFSSESVPGLRFGPGRASCRRTCTSAGRCSCTPSRCVVQDCNLDHQPHGDSHTCWCP